MFAGGGGGKPKNDPYVKRLQHGEQVAKKRPPDNDYFFPRGGGVEGRKLTLPPPPLCGRPCLYYIYFLRECSRKMYSKTHQIEQ